MVKKGDNVRCVALSPPLRPDLLGVGEVKRERSSSPAVQKSLNEAASVWAFVEEYDFGTLGLRNSACEAESLQRPSTARSNSPVAC